MIITISRQFSSGGREIAKKLAEKLQLAYYDKELIEEVSKKTGFKKEYIEEYSEAAISRTFPQVYGRSFVYYQQMPADQIQVAQADIIKEVGEKGNAVIVGRCADDLLKSGDVLKVFIYASNMESRITRCKAKGNDDKTDKELLKEITQIDKKRAKYYEYYTGKKWGDMENYNLFIDTTKIGIEKAVELICCVCR